MRHETAAEIDAAAAAWAAKLACGPLSPEDDEAFQSWIAGDVRRAGALGVARGVWLHAERARALGSAYDPERFARRKPSPLSRRGLLIGAGGAVAACAAGAVMFGIGGAGRRYETQLGEVKVVPLADGSVVTLNTASALAVRFTREARRIRLLAGEALFDVAHDAGRPFLVEAGDSLVRAVGTSFTVRRFTDAPAQVLVREGLVEVRRDGRGEAVRLGANMRLPMSAAAPPVRVAATEVGRELAWREGRIAFEGETLREAAAEFSRYSETRILIDDPAVAEERVAGMFQANDPVGFARAIALSLRLRTDVGENYVRITR